MNYKYFLYLITILVFVRCNNFSNTNIELTDQQIKDTIYSIVFKSLKDNVGWEANIDELKIDSFKKITEKGFIQIQYDESKKSFIEWDTFDTLGVNYKNDKEINSFRTAAKKETDSLYNLLNRVDNGNKSYYQFYFTVNVSDLTGRKSSFSHYKFCNEKFEIIN